jgi:hypothetical protein
VTAPGTGVTPRISEIDVLLACTQGHLDPARSARLRELASRSLDWDFVVRMAHQHHITPLVHHALSQACPHCVPRHLLEELADAATKSAARSHRLLGELLALLRLFGDHAIAAVPYKGPVLALSTYGDVTRRDFRDLDIVVHRRDVMRAKDLLVREGYRPIPHPTAADEREALEVGYAWQFLRHRDGVDVKVEIHWAFAPRYLHVDLDLEDLTGHLEVASIAGTALQQFGPEDTLFTLCVHGCKDLWQRLMMVGDVAEVIRGPRPIDWARAMEQASACNSERMLILGVRLARDLLEAPLPRAVGERVDSDPVAHSLAGKVRDRLFSETDEPVKPFAFYIELVQR